jgi:hypothetical protein
VVLRVMRAPPPLAAPSQRTPLGHTSGSPPRRNRRRVFAGGPARGGLQRRGAWRPPLAESH